AILFIPLLFGLQYLYPWADARQVNDNLLLQHRHHYLNPTGFAVRMFFYFALWIGWAWIMVRRSERYDAKPNPNFSRITRRFAVAGLVIYVLTMTLASIDWIMSREIEWYSTVFGLIVVVGQALTSLLFLIVVLTLLLKFDALRSFVTRGHYNDLGNLIL